MKSTLENKEKFFTQYWGQNVFRSGRDNDRTRYGVEWSNVKDHYEDGEYIGYRVLENAYLELKPLSQITDEDALEIARLNPYADFREGADPQPYVEHSKGFIYNPDFQLASYADFLRSKGYALPYMGISVEQQIEWGWIKLEQQ